MNPHRTTNLTMSLLSDQESRTLPPSTNQRTKDSARRCVSHNCICFNRRWGDERLWKTGRWRKERQETSAYKLLEGLSYLVLSENIGLQAVGRTVLSGTVWKPHCMVWYSLMAKGLVSSDARPFWQEHFEDSSDTSRVMVIMGQVRDTPTLKWILKTPHWQPIRWWRPIRPDNSQAYKRCIVSPVWISDERRILAIVPDFLGSWNGCERCLCCVETRSNIILQ